MRRVLLCGVGWLVVLLLVKAPVADARDSGAELQEQLRPPLTFHEQKQLRDFLVETYWGQLNSIKSVEYHYEHQPARPKPGKPWKGQYARDGRRFRHKDVSRGIDTLWDGQHAYMLVGGKLARRETDSTCATPPMPVVEHKLSLTLERIYGIEPNTDMSLRHAYPASTFSAGVTPYSFLGAAEVQFEGRACIELRFTSRNEQHIVTTRHARDLGYWPVYVHFARANGLSSSETTAFRYHKKVEAGRVTYFPVYFETRMRAPRGNCKSSMRIDEKTLRLNEKVDEAQFKVDPTGDKATTTRASP